MSIFKENDEPSLHFNDRNTRANKMNEDNTTIAIPLDEVLRVRQLLEELVRFLHQSMHYEKEGAVSEWLGSGVYTELSQVFYRVTWEWLPDSEKAKIENR